MPHKIRKVSKLRKFTYGVNKKDPVPKPHKLEKIIVKQLNTEILKIRKEQDVELNSDR